MLRLLKGVLATKTDKIHVLKLKQNEHLGIVTWTRECYYYSYSITIDLNTGIFKWECSLIPSSFWECRTMEIQIIPNP